MENITNNTKSTISNPQHIMACLSPSPSNITVIQSASSMAKAFGGGFTALFIQTPDFEKNSRENKARLTDNINLAQRLGAQVVTLYEDDIAFRIAEYAKLAGVTKVVIGESLQTVKSFFSKPTITSKLVKLLPAGRVHIIPCISATKPVAAKYDFSPPSAKDSLKTVAIITAATLTGVIFAALGISESSIILVYILAVLLASLFTDGYGCGVMASVLSVLLFDFLFTHPRFTFHAIGASYPVTFGVMLISSLVISTLAARLKRNASQSARSAYGTKLLFDTNKLLMKAENESDILAIGAKQIMQLVSGDVVCYTRQNGALGPGQTFQTNPAAKNMFLFIAEEMAAKWAFANKKSCGRYMEDFSDAKGLYIPVKTERGIYGVIGIMAAETDYFADNIVMSIIRECAVSVENVRNAREKQLADEKIKTEQLRSGLLRTISHDLRTPLTAISGNRDNLLVNSDKMDEKDILQAYKDIQRDSRWLIGVVENILSVTRMGEDKMQLNMTEELIEDVVSEAADIMIRKKSGHNIVTDFSGELLMAKMDRRLIMQVIINLVENRIKYTPSTGDIIIKTERAGDMLAVSVIDNGPGISDNDKEHIFEMFYTCRKTTADSRRSIGLGLSLCKSIVDAHGGSITVKDNKPQGSIFMFTLPLKEVNIHE